MESVERLSADNVDEKLWAFEGNWRSEREMGKADGEGLVHSGCMAAQSLISDDLHCCGRREVVLKKSNDFK